MKRSYRAIAASVAATGLVAGAGVALAAIPRAHSTGTITASTLTGTVQVKSDSTSLRELARLQAQLSTAGVRKAELRKRIAAVQAQLARTQAAAKRVVPPPRGSEATAPQVPGSSAVGEPPLQTRTPDRRGGRPTTAAHSSAPSSPAAPARSSEPPSSEHPSSGSSTPSPTLSDDDGEHDDDD